MTAIEAYILARAYTRQAIEGAGALKGAPCQIQSIEAITGGNRITFAWETGEGETETDTLDVMDGADGDDGVGIASITYKETDAQGNNIYTVTLTSGSTYDITCPKGVQGETGATGATGNGIVSIAKTSTEGLVDTYTITYTNGSTSTFTVTNGATPTVDNEMSESSENPLQNKVITAWTSAATKSVTGNPITISDAAAVKAKALSVTIEPVQDLHGYDKPWVGGADKNKFATSFNQLDTNYIGCDEFTVDAGDYVFKFKNISSSVIAFWATDTSDITDTTTHNVGAGQTASVNYTVGAGGKAKFSMRYTPVTSGITPSDITEIALYKSNDVPDTFTPYENICPITGHTEASVQRVGSNFLDTSTTGSFVQDANGYVTYTYSGGSTDPRPFNYNNAQYKLRLPAGSYKLVTDVKEATDVVYAETQLITSASVVKFSSKPFGTVGISSASFTLSEPTDIGIMSKQYTAVARFMIVKSTDSNDYVPYKGKTYTIALGSTIYGGTVDFDSGVMTVDRAVVDLGDFTWGTPSSGAGSVSSTTSISGAVNPAYNSYKADMVCSQYDVLPYYRDGVAGHDANSTNCSFAIWVTEGNKLFVRDANLIGKTAEETKTYLTGVQVLYMLATPTTVQLTPQQIQLLKGTNTLTGNGASISLTYQQDNLVGEVMEQVQPQIDDLQGQIDEIPRLVNYSTTEQKTGQKWIDGRDIYQKSIKVLAADFVQDGNLYRIDYPLQSTDEVLNIVAIAHSASYGDVILGSKAYSDNTPTAYWEMVTYYNYLALTFSGGLTFAIVSPEYIDATYFYVKSTT